MDIKKTREIRAIDDPLSGKPSNKSWNQDKTAKQFRREEFSLWSADEAVSLAGALAGSLSLESQKILKIFAAEMQPLRTEIDRLTACEINYREIARNHTFLQIPNRREFLRELEQAIDDVGSLKPQPEILIFHIANAGDFRRQQGRFAADAMLSHFAEALASHVHPNDIIGSIGGDDFGVILTTGEAEMLSYRANEMRAKLRDACFIWQGLEYRLDVFVGWSELQKNCSPENACELADRSLRSNLMLHY